MKSFFIWVLTGLCLASAMLQAQDQHRLDSLYHLLNDKEDTTQMKVNRMIGDLYIDHDPRKALPYFEKAKSIALVKSDHLRIGNIYYSMGYCYLCLGDLDKSIEHYLSSVRHYEKEDYDPSLADAYLSIISVYTDMKNYSKAKQFFHQAETKLQHSKDSFQLCSLYTQAGNLYKREGNLDSGFYFLNKGLSIANQSNDIDSRITCLSNLSLVYKELKNYTTAKAYCDTALQLILKQPDNPTNKAIVYNNLGAILSKQHKYAEAEQHFNQSIIFAQQAGILNVEMENYRNLAELFENKGDYKQHSFYLKKFIQLKDSIFNDESKNRIQQLESDYVIGKKDLELLKKEASIQRQTSQRNIVILIASGILILLIIAIYFNRLIQKKRNETEAQNKLIREQKEQLQNLNQVKDRLFSVISHDLRHPLNTLQSYLMLSDNESMAADKRLLFKNQSIQAVAQTGNLLDNLLTWANMQIRDTTPKIIPTPVTDIIQDVVDLVKPQALQKNIQIEINTDQQKVLTDATILSIAIRNIITNAIKFSHQDSQIQIEGKCHQDYYRLSIIDHGIGMSPEQIIEIQTYSNAKTNRGTAGESGTGLGLFLVIQLLERVGTSLNIQSEKGHGSRFIMDLKLA